jgi:hypothetical protein
MKVAQVRARAAATRRETAARNRRAVVGPTAADCASEAWADGIPPTATVFGAEPDLFEDAAGTMTDYAPVGTLAEPERALWAAPWYGGLGTIVRPAKSVPVVVVRKRADRPTCERCGQSFRQSGIGYQWHVANRPDCAARA